MLMMRMLDHVMGPLGVELQQPFIDRKDYAIIMGVTVDHYYKLIMSSKFKPISKNLYTLNQQSATKNDDHFLNSAINSAHKTNLVHNHYQPDQTDSESDTDNYDLEEMEIYEDNTRQEIQKLTNVIHSLEEKINALKISNKELTSANEMAEFRNKKHEERQREIIKKLSHQQITSQQLEYEIKKYIEEIARLKQSSKQIDKRNYQANNCFKKVEQQQLLFFNSLKKVGEVIGKCQKVEDFQVCLKKFQQFIYKNLPSLRKAIQHNDDDFAKDQFSLDLSFQLNEMSGLRNKLAAQEEKYRKLIKEKQRELQNEKSERKRIITAYNQKINRVKEQSEELKGRIEEREEEMQREMRKLKSIIGEKNDIIDKLRHRMEVLKQEKSRDYVREINDNSAEFQNSLLQVQKKNPSQCSRNSRAKGRKKSFYIGDGEHSNTDYMINQLESHIEKLERDLIEELEH